MWWPVVTRCRYDEVRLENFTLREALRSANEEIRRQRACIYQLNRKIGGVS